MCSVSFLIMELVRNFLAMKVIKTLQLLNFNFSVQFGDIESIYFLTAPNRQTKAGFNTVVLMLLISRSYRVVKKLRVIAFVQVLYLSYYLTNKN